MDDKHLHQLLAALITFLVGLTPAALGALVSLAYEKGLTWRERFIQFAVGVVVSYFAGGLVGALWPWKPMDPFVLQSITFTLGMIAFKATPKFISNSSEAIGALPGDIRDRLITWLPKKKDDGQ